MSWVLMVVFGLFAMWCMRWTPNWADFVLVRVAGFSFIGAGLVGASGWVGEGIDGTLGALLRAINGVSDSALGTGIGWIIAAGISAIWIGGMLPDRIFSYDPPDWLVIAGIIVPALVGMVPGKAGSGMNTVISLGGNALNGFVGGIFS